MKLNGAKRQTLFLTVVNGIVRAMGLSLKVIMARMLGAEIMGVIEIAQSAHMVAIAPLTSGLPAAVSRLTAKAEKHSKHHPLNAGLYLVRKISFFIIPLFWMLSPLIARLMGDLRVLPSLYISSLCVLILGYSAVYNGYSYGIEKSELPALSELIEQVVRFLLTIFLMCSCIRLAMPWLAAMPLAATLVAEVIGLIFMLVKHKKIPTSRVPPSPAWTKAVFRLSAPATLMRMIQTILRSFTSVVIPIRLQASGLSSAEATSLLGMLNGMVMPFLMLPGILTNALSVITLPKIAKAEENPSEIRRILILCLLLTLPLSVICAVMIYLGAPLLANRMYRHAELTTLFRWSASQLVLFPISHLLLNTLSALGKQKLTLAVSLLSALFSLAITWFLAGEPNLRILGVILSQYASQFFTIGLSLVALIRWRADQRITIDDRFA